MRTFIFFAILSALILDHTGQAEENGNRLLPLVVPQEWTLFCPATDDGIDLGKLTSIPAEMNGAPGQRVRFTDYAFLVDRAITKSGPAIFLYEFDSERDGLMQAGGGADWFWTVTANGQTVLDLLKNGNMTGPITHRNHAFYIPVKKGRNLVAAKVLRGSNGWKFAYGPVPFTAFDNGVIAQPGLATTDCILTFGDGRQVAQSGSLRDAKIDGKGKDFQLAGTLGEGIRLSLRSQEFRTKAGNYAIRLAYALETDQPMQLESAKVVLRFPAAFAVGASARIADKEVPAAELATTTQGMKDVTLSDSAYRVVCSTEAPVLSLLKTDGLEISAAFPDLKGKTSAKTTLTIEPGVPPFQISAGKDWAPLRLERTVEPGSILDFSFLADRQAPAGKHGRVVPGPDGRFVYEKTGERARLVGANLCFDANYIPKEECDALAEVFRRQGYNAVRFHHTDVHMIKGIWNAQNSYEIDPQMLDRLDYLLFAMKRAGMYATIDFYTMRYFGPGEIAGVDSRIACDIKPLIPVSDSAFQAWSKLVVAWMDHVNPYTGLAWKDDPALVFACPLNEDTIFSVLGDNSLAMTLFQERYQAWKKDNGVTGDDIAPLKKDPRFTRFAIETKRASNRRIAAFLKEHGIGIPLSGSNWWNTEAQAFTRAEFDVVDNHQYADHPFNGNYNQGCSIKGDLSRINPVFMMPTRIIGKPFTVTEFNYCFPNQYRAEGGALFGACSALQDWDAVYRFAWSHGRDKNLNIHPASGFDVSSDPLSLYTDRQISLLFARGDVAPARLTYSYAVTMSEATKDGFGGMWSGGLFPSEFSTLGLVSRIGSQPLAEGEGIRKTFSGVCSKAALAESQLGGNKLLTPDELVRVTSPDTEGDIVSDTGEIRINPTLGRFRVVTPKTECLVSAPGGNLTGRYLSAREIDTFTSVSASAMDGKPLDQSARVLVFHLTNVLNSGMKFSNPEMRRIEEIGVLPHLARCGKAVISLQDSVPGLKVYAIASSGRRVRDVPATYVDGIYRFTAQIIAGDQEPVLAYELAP